MATNTGAEVVAIEEHYLDPEVLQHFVLECPNEELVCIRKRALWSIQELRL